MEKIENSQKHFLIFRWKKHKGKSVYMGFVFISISSVFFYGSFRKDCCFKRNYLRLIGAEVRDSCGSSGRGETPQAFTPRRLTARTKESEHLEGKSTTTHYLVNSNKVCENSLFYKQYCFKSIEK
ncbi:hypothetical protein IFR10_09615 [Bacillus sp. CFBP 13597]|nr:hypothetical protein [Bacillus sp. CFBP 13597]